MSKLQKLTLQGVVFCLPALQAVATRLRELNVFNSRLQGSSDGFLTRGWTNLTMLSLRCAWVMTATMTAALELPALEEIDIRAFQHQGGVLTGSCPNIRGLGFRQDGALARGREGGGLCCSLLNLGQLASLVMEIEKEPLQSNMDLNLRPSLTRLEFGGYSGSGGKSVDFFWALREAVKCVGRGAQLHTLSCRYAEAYLQPAQWGADLDEQHRRLGGQLSSLRELEVWGAQKQLLSVVGAVASAAPSLVSLKILMISPLSRVEVSSIRSASLESITVKWDLQCPKLPPPQVLLTLLPGCTRLRTVLVHFIGRPVEGAAIKIRCHCRSRRCIVPMGFHNGVNIRFLHMQNSEQGVQESTVLSSYDAAVPGQPLVWGHAVMPGIL